MKFGGKQTEDVGDPLPDVRNQRLKLLQGVGVDDRGVHSLEIEQCFDVFGSASCNDGQHMQVVAIVYDAGDFCCKTDRSAFKLPAGQPNGPGIEFLYSLQLGCQARRRGWPLIGGERPLVG